jgi:hypothetical protein
VLVLDMGEPVRIIDLARRLIAAVPTPIEVVFTGLRSGEKLTEGLLGHGELDDRPYHPVSPLPPDLVTSLDPAGSAADLRAELARCAEVSDLPAADARPPGRDIPTARINGEHRGGDRTTTLAARSGSDGR